MFGPQSCDSQTSICYGGLFDPQKSTSVQDACSNTNDCPPFEIQYGTPGSGVNGSYFQDNFGIGGKAINNLTMAIASSAAFVPTGIMGIGFALGESLEELHQTYSNLPVVMANQSLIPSASYSLYLDDLGMSSLTLRVIGRERNKKTALTRSGFSSPSNLKSSLKIETKGMRILAILVTDLPEILLPSTRFTGL
jgi:hypothetical protein